MGGRTGESASWCVTGRGVIVGVFVGVLLGVLVGVALAVYVGVAVTGGPDTVTASSRCNWLYSVPKFALHNPQTTS